MKRLVLSILMLSLFAQSLSAGGKDFLGRFHPGIEWGYSGNMFNFHHFNYLDESIGFRINEEEWTAKYSTNAFAYASLSFDLPPYFTTSILTGFEGIDKGRRIIPLLARLSYYPFFLDQDGIFLFLDGGIALKHHENDKYVKQVQLGGGYSLMLCDHSKLSFNLGFRLAYDRPDVWDPIEEEYVSGPVRLELTSLWESTDFKIFTEQLDLPILECSREIIFLTLSL